MSLYFKRQMNGLQ